MTTGSSTDAASNPEALQALVEETRRALHASEQREADLRIEVDHRIRNALAVTRSVLMRTMATATSVEDARNHLTGRLDALARYQNRSAALADSAFDFETMIWDELLAVASAGDPRIAVVGPSVHLAPQVAAVIGLALHELATNSVKFGVLAEPSGSGRLRIKLAERDGEVTFQWSESGVPIVSSEPIASGFGQDYIEQALPYQLGATTSFDLVPGGVCCRIAFRSAENQGSGNLIGP